MNYIFNKKIKYCTKEIFKITKVIVFGLIIIIGIILIKYKPLYKVELNGIEVGYIKDKKEFEENILNYIETREDDTIAFKMINSEPKYNIIFSNGTKTNEEEILEDIKKTAKTTYTAYGITINDDVKTYVKTEEEANKVINNLSEDYKENNEYKFDIKQIYANERPEIVNEEKAVAKVKNIRDTIIDEKERSLAIAVINDVKITSKPVDGMITSRFAEVSRIRSGAHTGLDIATKSGTDIKACASGTVIFAKRDGSYGNLVKIEHENGVETWYAHCDKIYVEKGKKVNAGDVIAAVGSTGNSTGPHLHLEIRINGEAINPQKYLYKN